MTTFADQPIKGFDVSQNQDNRATAYLPDLRKAKDAIGAEFMGIRIGYGQVTDRLFEYYWRKAKTIQLARLPYFYLDFYSYKTLGITRVEWGTRQAIYAWALLRADPGEAPLHLDIEAPNTTYPINWLTAPGVMEVARAFKREYERVSKGKLSLYTTPGLMPYFDDEFKDCGLWLAWYNRAVTKAQIDAVLKKHKWRSRAYIHQYTSDGDIDNDGTKDGIRAGMETADLDLDVFLGSRQEWSEYLGKTMAAPTTELVQEDQPAAPAGEHTYRLAKVVCTSGLNIRSQVGTSSQIVGWLYPGETVEVIQAAQDNAKNQWGRIGHEQWCAVNYNGLPMLQLT